MNKPLLFSWISSLIATLGSLYFSEVLHYTPCTLCWYQRILMYPLTLILGIAFYQGDRNVYKYVLPISIVGIFISAYHYSLQKIPFLQKFEMCTSGVPCSGEYINLLGFITIPFLALLAFSLITMMTLVLRKG
ncbi:MAG: disulfide oxidoreductase [Bacillota bacterium]